MIADIHIATASARHSLPSLLRPIYWLELGEASSSAMVVAHLGNRDQAQERLQMLETAIADARAMMAQEAN